MGEELVLSSEVEKFIDDTRRKAIDDTTQALHDQMLERLETFSWKQPMLTPEQIKKAALLQERTTQRRFIDLNMRPEDHEPEFLLASFKVTPPKGESLLDAANHVTLESSTGTWTDVQTETSFTLSLAGTVYHAEEEIEGRAGHVKVAYPLALFEPGSISQLFSCIAGNLLAMKAVEKIKLMDFHAPEGFIRSFPGPRFGIPGIREVSNVKGHTLVGTIVKPKTGLFPQEYAQVMYDTFRYACVVKDDENLTDQAFCPFALRTYLCYQKIEQVERELAQQGIRERKIYLPNVTTRDAVESLWKAYYVHRLGARSLMVDIVTGGFEMVQAIRNYGPPLIIHGHRAMHAAFARPEFHGVDMMVIAKASRLAGIDELHIGTVVGKMEGGANEVLNYHHAIKDEDFVPENYENKEDYYQWYLPQKWYGMKPVMSVNSGGLYPKHLIDLKKLFGTDTVTTMGGGIHAYGTLDGAWGARLLAYAAAKGYDAEYVRKNYHEVVEELGFPYTKPEEEAYSILDRMIAGKDWKALSVLEK